MPAPWGNSRRRSGPSRLVARWVGAAALALVAGNCSSGSHSGQEQRAAPADSGGEKHGPRLPLVEVQDVELPGRATRFDYQDLDPALDRLVVAHMNDGAVVVVDLKHASVIKELTGVPTARGVVVAEEIGVIFVTSSPDQLVRIDHESLQELGRVKTGNGPDGVGWDPVDRVVGVSDQGDGALSLISDSGQGARQQIALGSETGNVVFDRERGWFWITVVRAKPPDQLVAVEPVSGKIEMRIDLPGCSGAHGLRLHPDDRSAFVACESNSTLARVALDGDRALQTGSTGEGPDVMSIDAELGWLYVAAESGELTVFDIARNGVARLGSDRPGDDAHSVAVDPATHRVFFPLMAGPSGKPVLRIMRPTGI